MSPAFEPGLCANCDSSAVTVKTPLFCSQWCRQVAEFVRYARACRRDGRDQQPDVKEAIKMRAAMVLGGSGYPERERRVTLEVRAAVFERAEGKCEGCGRVLDFDRSSADPDAIATIQHRRNNSSDLDNLRAFCRRCNIADAQSRFVPVETGTVPAAIARYLSIRVTAPTPLRLCDDDQQWKTIWQGLSREAKAVIEEHGLDEDAYGDEDLPGFLGWTEQGTPIQDC